jgi:hypothetical protein
MILPLIETVRADAPKKIWLTQRNLSDSKLTGLQLSPAKGQGDSSAAEGTDFPARFITR